MAYVINHPQFTPPNDFQVFLAFIVFLAAEIGALRLEDIIIADSVLVIYDPSWVVGCGTNLPWFTTSSYKISIFISGWSPTWKVIDQSERSMKVERDSPNDKR